VLDALASFLLLGFLCCSAFKSYRVQRRRKFSPNGNAASVVSRYFVALTS
jgi:hypothetical protein